jgi:hypothetical protein
MSKGKKRCYVCGCALTNQNRNSIRRKHAGLFYDWIWVDCCHSCKAKEHKKP